MVPVPQSCQIDRGTPGNESHRRGQAPRPPEDPFRWSGAKSPNLAPKAGVGPTVDGGGRTKPRPTRQAWQPQRPTPSLRCCARYESEQACSVGYPAWVAVAHVLPSAACKHGSFCETRCVSSHRTWVPNGGAGHPIVQQTPLLSGEESRWAGDPVDRPPHGHTSRCWDQSIPASFSRASPRSRPAIRWALMTSAAVFGSLARSASRICQCSANAARRRSLFSAARTR